MKKSKIQNPKSKIKRPKKAKLKKQAKKPKQVEKAMKKVVAKPEKKASAKSKKIKAAKKTVIKEIVGKKAPVQLKKEKSRTGEYSTVYLSLGSNVGDREEYIEQAIALLKESSNVKVVRRASNFETQPEGNKAQPLFINSTVEISTNLAPDKLLELAQSIEDTLGRERGVEWGPRTIDIDILLYGNELISEDNLIIPHPLMHDRLFVLEPLMEIAPHVVHPVLERTIKELYKDKKTEAAEKYEEDFREIKKGIGDDYEHW